MGTPGTTYQFAVTIGGSGGAGGVGGNVQVTGSNSIVTTTGARILTGFLRKAWEAASYRAVKAWPALWYWGQIREPTARLP